MKVLIFAVAVTLLGATAAAARTLTIDIMRADVQTSAPQDAALGNYFTFNLAIPAKLPAETFMDATLELYVDAWTEIDEAADGGITTLEVFPLNRNLTAELNTSDLRPAAMKHTVRTGENQRVRLNISEHVRYLLENPTENYGLAVGSLTGQRLSKFTLRHGELGEGVVARARIIFQELGMPVAERP